MPDDCVACGGPHKEPECGACAAKDKTITELIAALSLAREREPVIFPAWPFQHPHPPSVPSVSPMPLIYPSPSTSPYVVTNC